MESIIRLTNLLFASLLFAIANVSAQDGSYPQIRLFIDGDSTFVAKAGSVAEATQAIAELTAQVDAIYRSQLGLTVTIAATHLWTTSDPFDRSNQSTLLSSFAQYSETNYRTLYSYDVAFLLVGSGLGGEGGIAYSSSACGDITSAPFAYGLAQPDLTDTYQFNAHLLSHELGHTLGAEHDELPGCAKQTIMCQAQIGGQFSSVSRTAISSYVERRRAAGCFSNVTKTDPATNVRLALSYSGSTIGYSVTGAERCTSLSLVASPSREGLNALFGYLQLGTLPPSQTVRAQSKGVLKLIASRGRIYVGAYCDGQLIPSIAKINPTKLRGRLGTPSISRALRSLQRRFSWVR